MLTRAGRLSAHAGAAAFAGLTLALVARMFWYLHLSMSNALRIDQWVMLEELWRFHDGRFGWSYLWTPYWGQRIVVPRLLFLLDERWFHFSNTPLVWINIGAQCGMCAVLGLAAWRLLKEAPGYLRIAVPVVIAHLVFSSLQLENLVYGMSVQYSIGLVAALAAIALFGISPRHNAAAVACALVATLSLASGLFVWPILVAEGLVLRVKRSTLIGLVAAWLLLIGVYAAGYSNPGSGMGAVGILRRPLQAFLIAALFLGGPISDVRGWLGEVAGVCGIGAAAYYSVLALRRDVGREFVILTAICWYVLATAVSIPLGRMTPEWVAERGALGAIPSRYFTAAFLFWGCTFALSASTVEARVITSRISRNAIPAVVAIVVAGLTVGTICWQLWESMDWLAYYRKMDAAASGFLAGASDPQYTAEMYPEQRLLDHWAPYLKEHRLSVFADQRANWMGRETKEVFAGGYSAACKGRVDETAALGSSSYRLTGYLTGTGISLTRKTDIVLAGADGRVAGLGRTMATKDGRGGVKFLGYTGGPERFVTAFAVMPGGQLCRLSQ